MLLRIIILGGVIAAFGATLVAAQTPADQDSGSVSLTLASAAVPPLAPAPPPTYRPVARPVHMIRYPVQVIAGAPSVRPRIRPDYVPATRWGDGAAARTWTRATMAAVADRGLDSVVPADIATWCPAYEGNGPAQRQAFWVGMMSALSQYESGQNPAAVGGGGSWYGLLQIMPATAAGSGCDATTGAALQDPVANLSCAARIMARTVKRDGVVADGGGVAADWGPMSRADKAAAMAAWTSEQAYCTAPVKPRVTTRITLRPTARPVHPGADAPDLRLVAGAGGAGHVRGVARPGAVAVASSD